MVYVILGTGFEEVEAITPVDLLRRAGIPTATVGINGKVVYGSHGIGVEADLEIGQMDLTEMDMIVLPGGLKGVASIRASCEALDAVRFAWDNGKYTAAICAAPTVLADLGITQGRKATCYPGFEGDLGTPDTTDTAAVVTDGKLITGASAGCAIPFALALIAALKGQESADGVAHQIVIR